jgi:hypothetical protein
MVDIFKMAFVSSGEESSGEEFSGEEYSADPFYGKIHDLSEKKIPYVKRRCR